MGCWRAAGAKTRADLQRGPSQVNNEKVYNLLYRGCDEHGDLADPDPVVLLPRGCGLEELTQHLDMFERIFKKEGWLVEKVDNAAHGQLVLALGATSKDSVRCVQPVAWDPDSDSVIPEQVPISELPSPF